MIYQLNYSSKASEELQTPDLSEILQKAKHNNSEVKVSGCLVYHNNSFVQILEGEKKAVIDLYRKIENDVRHHSISLLWEANVEQRYFAEWNMAFYRPNEENMVQFVNNMLLLSQLSDKSSGALLSFWGNVHRMLKGGSADPLEQSFLM